MMNTKKWFAVTSIAIVALVAVVMLAPVAFAQGPMDNFGPGSGSSPRFSNSSGGYGSQMRTDNFAGGPMTGQRGQGQGTCDGNNFVDEDGDGICDTAGTGQGNGAGFVDEDGDGTCDHAGQGRQGQSRGQGQGRRGGMKGQQAQQSN